MNSALFSSLSLTPDMLKNLETLGYEQMTPIQAKSLPFILKNHDVLAKAKTGSGKTAAFGLGLLAKLGPIKSEPQALVICPTRELADQVGKEIRRLARLTHNIRVLLLCGGKPFRVQADSLRRGTHIIVGTPGRIQDHIERGTLNLNHIQTLVLDEADRMLDMGFYEKIINIIERLPKNKQTLLFSATYPNTIKQISQLIQKNPVEVTVDSKEDVPDITQKAYQIKDCDKNETVTAILKHYNVSSAIIFCRTKIQCNEVAKKLSSQGIHALAIHGDLEQRDRDEVLLQFSNQSCTVLVATDVAARGLDIKDLPLVINYDLPNNADTYVHRIGRTGRGGQSGLAISLYQQSEAFRIDLIEKYSKLAIERAEITSLKNQNHRITGPGMRTLCINGGKKNKVRPGDILGALTGDAGLSGDQVGKIDIFDFHSYVAISRKASAQALNRLQEGKIKGRAFRVRYLDRASVPE